MFSQLPDNVKRLFSEQHYLLIELFQISANIVIQTRIWLCKLIQKSSNFDAYEDDFRR